MSLLTPGSRLGPYEILSSIGAGGMGEVFRARDMKLNRDVALKLLLEAVALDGERLARFKREAQVLASLNHPQIAAIYGFEDSSERHALVMEFVDGPTLADRIAQGPIPVNEALPIARQIADALEAAHEQGIVHRDLKPANIKIRNDGTVKVLDFGLAKAFEVEGASGSSSISMSPTLSSPAMTGMGMILGTAAYMSPEQAKGRPVDKRTDVWAFGCVLYEMLTATRPFEGEDIADTLAYVLTKEPDWSKLPADLPPAVNAILRRCITKDRRKRTGDIAAVQFILDEGIVLPAQESAAPRPQRSLLLPIAVAVVAVAVTAFATWELSRPVLSAPQPARFAIVSQAPRLLELLSPGGAGRILDRAILITPDGKNVIYRTRDNSFSGANLDGGSAWSYLVRPIDQLETRPLTGLVLGGREIVASPDGSWIAASMAGGSLKKAALNGGPAIEIARYPGDFRGQSWADDDSLVFATVSGVYTVPSGGGEPKQIVPRAASEPGLAFPWMLPGSQALLVTQEGSTLDQAQIVLVDLKSKQRRVLIPGGYYPQYVNSGHIIYGAAGSLRAVPFDLKKLALAGDPVPVVDGVVTGPNGQTSYSVSRNGTLVYVPGGASRDGSGGARRTLVWVDRQGREEPTGVPERAYTYPRISPDGTRVALDIRDQENDIWVWDIQRKILTRLTFDPGVERAPFWTPDSKRVIFGSQQPPNIFWQAADGTGVVQRLTTATHAQYPNSVTSDGSKLVIRDDASGQPDLAMISLGAGATANSPVRSLIQTKFIERNGDVSPDGAWLVYESNESGQVQIYVRPFPNVDGGRWQISTGGGGTRPLWAHSGREIFYIDSNGKMTSVPVQTKPTFTSGIPKAVFDKVYFTPTGNTERTYDVSADGQHFLMLKDSSTTEGAPAAASAPPIIVVTNWFEELKKRVPAKQTK